MEMLPLDNQYNFRGNIIPDEWYVMFTNGRGSPDLPLISKDLDDDIGWRTDLHFR